ncbi:hypothetical protein JOM56_011468 [Amanita muscaria]
MIFLTETMYQRLISLFHQVGIVQEHSELKCTLMVPLLSSSTVVPRSNLSQVQERTSDFEDVHVIATHADILFSYHAEEH